jgi:hypothetical protein
MRSELPSGTVTPLPREDHELFLHAAIGRADSLDAAVDRGLADDQTEP